ncbi:multiple epidermal growth factor-like domains protein 10 [Crassostrea angulata]|uniref:multiple epidermal growth factor-like domains protein 10 n=1 Tax=Magallana angulata TaxID=2784310 RepID=UPI0022B1A725|nr:multiple epidermal growth factor-like domains protein 10 [Crassostrea angulata]
MVTVAKKTQRRWFAGFSLYTSNTELSTISDRENSTLCYKDGPQLPPLNFTTTCTEHGRYDIFYNERLDGVTYPAGYKLHNVYTELCEVIVLACDEGWYGDNCSQQCVGHCRDNTSCNHVTGQCERGCGAGWTGIFCDNVCDDGKYGYNCVNNCSGHCMNGSLCNKEHGHCDKGCDPGYTNRDCSIECSSGYFGMKCRGRCSGNCINNEACDHITGICPRGCMDGYIGRHCNISCQSGYFGTNYSFPCWPHCKTCRHTDGRCSCRAGWRGHDCSIECTHSYGENCQYSCSGQCINQTCDRFNGKCLCDGKYDGLRNVEFTTDVSACTFRIAAFSISLVINIIFLFATILSRRKAILKPKSTTKEKHFSRRSGSKTEQTATSVDPSHYQELQVSQPENTYQTLHQQ